MDGDWASPASPPGGSRLKRTLDDATTNQRCRSSQPSKQIAINDSDAADADDAIVYDVNTWPPGDALTDRVLSITGLTSLLSILEQGNVANGTDNWLVAAAPASRRCSPLIQFRLSRLQFDPVQSSSDFRLICISIGLDWLK